MKDNKYYGIYQGVVSSIKDTEKRGRIKIKCPDVLGETESAWCDPVAYDGGGDFCMPALNETVWVMFIDGDANRPVWLGNWWQEDMTPLGKNYKNIDKLRIISYADCTITMKDGVININVGEGECDLRIEHNQVTVLGNLVVQGSITAGSVHAVKGEHGGGTILADSTVHGSNI